MKTVAILGSSSIKNIELVEKNLPKNPEVDIIVSNGGGISPIIQNYAKKHGLGFLIFYPSKEPGGPLKTFHRIALEADSGVVFWDCESSGVMYAVESMVLKKKSCSIITCGEPEKPHSGKDIKSFNGRNFWLSNLFPCKISVGKYVFPSVNNAYLAAKFYRVEELVRKFEAATPIEAYTVVKELNELHPEVERDFIVEEEYLLMERMIERKFSQNEYLMKKLMLTSEAYIENGDSHNLYWGTQDGEGKNRLGEIIMKFRSKKFR